MQPALGERSATPDIGLATVLVVDDNEDDREIYSRILYYNNFDVILAADAVEAVTVARARLPGVILMDVNLGEVSGLAAAEYIRSDPATQSIPIVCFTSMDLPIDHAKQRGCNDLLQKPVSAMELVSVIRRHMTGSAIPEAEPAETEPP